MKDKLWKAYGLVIGQLLSLLTVGYMVYYRYSTHEILLRPTKIHLWIQCLLSIALLYSLIHFIKIIKSSSKMRKAAQEQKEANSKKVERLIFMLMLALIFSSLFYTTSFRRYFPISLEYVVYFFNSIFELLVLISIIGSRTHTSKGFIKTKQIYAGFGAVSGLLLFYVYYQLII